MEKDEFFLKLNFSKDWIDLEIITPQILEELKNAYEIELAESIKEFKDDGTFEEYSWYFSEIDDEHYRWRAFEKFLERNDNLPFEILKRLYDLGDNDPDYTMGGAMMQRILFRKDCSLEILEMALESDRDFLVKEANRLILRRSTVE